ncbi:hypothetical protein ACFXPY_45815, partial [Streptomyces sp. NPDC059153]
GIGNLANKVKSVFHAVAKPVNRAIDKIVDFIAKKGKALWAKLKGKDKPKKKDRDKDRTEAPSDLRLAARQAAERGWDAAAQRSRNEVVRGNDLESALQGAAKARDGVRIKLDVVESSATWRVKALAEKAGKRSTAEEGRGWVARGEQNERWYAARDLSAFNRSLVDEAFTELRGDTGGSDDAGDLHASYEQKIKAGRRIERTKQDRLDGRIRGLRFSISTESFSGAEKDKEIRTTMNVSPNETAKTGNVPLSGEVFPYKIGEAAGPVELAKARQPIDNLSRIRIPMLGKEAMTGYVVNMAAQPGEVEPNIASRYIDEAWAGSDAKELATASTAVVIGINTYKRLDPQENKEGKNTIRAAMAGIDQPNRLRMAAMGFTWTPSWEHISKGLVPLAEVRQAYQKLSDAEKRQAIAANESNWRDGKKLPYGIFREAVLGSSHTEKAVNVLSEVNQQVHVVSQDADGGVRTPSGRGVLAEYSQILNAMRNDPVLTIGGYTFAGFDWGKLAGSRTAQLTTLANAVDRAIRAAIAEVHPQMLYPTEPNALIKAWDNRTGDGIFQNPQIRAGLDSSQGSFYGIGAAEGRTARNQMTDAYGRANLSIAYTPTASTVTSPLPGDPTRGLTVTPEDVHELAAGERFPGDEPEDLRRSHRAYALVMQSQTTASAMNLAREFRKENPQGVRSGDQTRLQNAIFMHVEEMVKLMTEKPSLTMESDEVKRHLAALETSAKELSEQRSMANKEKPQAAVELSLRITREIIEALTAEELRDTWNKLHTLLDQIMKDPRPSQGGPQ